MPVDKSGSEESVTGIALLSFQKNLTHTSLYLDCELDHKIHHLLNILPEIAARKPCTFDDAASFSV